MKLGIQIPNFSYPNGEKQLGADLNDIVQLIDTSGFTSLWVMDHYYQINNLFDLPYTEPMMEGYSVLNYFAGLTQNVRLGTLVTGVIYRNPAFLVKQVTTLDVLSEGRAYFGVGAGWYKEEAEAYGFPFGTWTDRFEKLEEILQITKKMWSDESGSYTGKHFQLKDVHNSPQPIRGNIPIMIGGMGEKKTLRMVAQYADATNLFGRDNVEVLSHKLKVLKNHCDNLNRDFEEIEVTTLSTLKFENDNDINKFIEEVKELSKIGVNHVIVNIPTIYELHPIETLRDEVIPAISDL